MIVRCNEIDIAVDEQGSGDAVLFIHGHPFNRSMWQPQVDALASRYRVIAPDLRGYGDSGLGDASIPTTLEMFAGDLAALLDRLRVEKACVIGLSMGGQIAMEFARAFPARTNGLVLAATFARAETPEGVKQRNRMADELLQDGMAGPGCEMLPKLIGKTSLRRMPALAAQVYQMIVSTDPRGAAAALRGRAMRRDYTEFLGTLHVPALIIVGTEDAYTSVEEATSLHERMAGSRLEVFSDVGHMPNLEESARFNRVLSDFVYSAHSQYIEESALP